MAVKKGAQNKAAEEAKAAAEAEAAEEAKAKELEGMVTVISRSYIWEPFQKVPIHPGHPTILKLTSWVESQLEAKVLTEVEAE